MVSASESYERDPGSLPIWGESVILVCRNIVRYFSTSTFCFSRLAGAKEVFFITTLAAEFPSSFIITFIIISLLSLPSLSALLLLLSLSLTKFVHDHRFNYHYHYHHH